MKTLPYLLIFSIALFSYSCNKDRSALPENQTIPAHIQNTVDDAIAEVENDYKKPPTAFETGSRGVVYVPAGSLDALADAIEEAGQYGRVILESGDHWESGTVVISNKLALLGEPGAKLYVDVSAPGDPFPFTNTNVLDPAIYVKNCDLVWIKNIEIHPVAGSGSTGIFLENVRNARIEGNTVNGFQFGIWVSDQSENAALYDNSVVGPEPEGVWGLIVESGRNAKLKGNHVSKYASCIFGSDEKGIMLENTTIGSFCGPLLCTVQGNILLPNGSLLENAIPCNNWVVTRNKAYDSLWNYVVIDGSNNNILVNNQSFNPGSGQDIYLLGDSFLVGMFTPTSFENFVVNIGEVVTVDCGVDNTVRGGILLDGPCL